jgi:N-methylhydantoinase B
MPGGKGGFRTSLGTRPDIKLSQRFPAGTRFTLELPGAGGFNDPLERDPQAVANDVSEGLVSVASAARDYGVVVTRFGRIKALSRKRVDRHQH